MGADLSKLSTEDLLALKAGDLSKISTEGLIALKGQQAQAPATPAVGERLKHASDSWVSGVKIPDRLLEFATGGTGLTRGIMNLASNGAGDEFLPKAGDPNSGWKTAGALADPLAWAVGGGVPAAAGKAVGVLAPHIPAAQQALQRLGGHWAGRAGERAVTGATTGGVLGALSDEGTADSGAVIGSAANVVVPPIFGGVARGATALKEKVFPSPGALGVKAAGDKADEVIAALETANSGVPGVQLTAGQASVPANSAEFAALQKLAESKDPSRYVGAKGVHGKNTAARVAEVREIGKTPKALETAIENRSSASGANYEDAFGEVVKRDPELRALWKNPYFKKEVGDAWELLRAKELPLKENLTRFLHYVKLGLDAKLQSANQPGQPAINSAITHEVQSVKNKLVDWLGTRNDAYDAARLAHIDMSKPINQMKVGQSLEQALVAPGTGAERTASFGGAIRNAENTVSKATGKPRIEDLTQSQRNAMNAIEDNLKLNEDYKKLASAGASNLENRIGTPHAPPTGWFQPMVSAARSWLNTLLGSGHEKALHKLAPLLENPKEFAKLMEAATPQQRQVVNAVLGEYVARGTTIMGVASTDRQPRGALSQPQGVLSERYPAGVLGQ